MIECPPPQSIRRLSEATLPLLNFVNSTQHFGNSSGTRRNCGQGLRPLAKLWVTCVLCFASSSVDK